MQKKNQPTEIPSNIRCLHMHESEFPVEIQCASSLDEEWCRRAEHPIGLDENMQKLPLELYPEPEEGTEMDITWEACKCDRLDKEEFRRRYIRHRCEYHKTTGSALSEYERKEKEIRDQKIIRSFIDMSLRNWGEVPVDVATRLKDEVKSTL